jgi:hypothetical protein
MIGRILAYLVLGIFATIGFCCCLRRLAYRLCGGDETLVGIEILTQREADSAEELIRDALFRYLRADSYKVVIFTTPELLGDSRLIEAANKYGISCRISTEFAERNL